MSAKAILSASVSAAPVYVEDVFSTFLYTGNGSTQTITNGIDLSGEGGLVWLKQRNEIRAHFLYDTARGATNALQTNTTGAELAGIAGRDLYQYNSNGFTLGPNYYGGVNTSPESYCSWTFRKAPKFFDVVTYTGTGSAQNIPHNLGAVPGCIIIKRTETTGSWIVYHRALNTPETNGLILNATTQEQGPGVTGYWNSTLPTSTVFTVNTNASLNASGGTYVAYLFAHDAGGFGTAGTDNVVSCGTYTGNGSASGPTVTLGWEPQWVMIKNTTSLGGWFIFDNMRGMVSGGNDAYLRAESDSAEFTSANDVTPLATGFALSSSSGGTNDPSSNYIYIAIRRGPMKTPTVGTQVFNAVTYTGTGVNDRNVASGFSTDLFAVKYRNAGASGWTSFVDRLRGRGVELRTTSTGSEVAFDYFARFDVQNGVNVYNVNQYNDISDKISYHFRRAPGFFDVVAYTGTGSATTVSHNLGVAPELMIVKKRSASDDWCVYHKNLTNIGYTVAANEALIFLQDTLAGFQVTTAWNSTTPTSSVFSLGTYTRTNGSGSTFIAYLFSSLSGVSKVGSYTGTGTTKQIDCGFTAGARFVLIKRTDSTGDWYVWDTARGIISGNDPYLLLNSTAAEVTNTDYIDPLSSGFEISSTAPAAINANGGSFIFLAIS